MKKFVCFLAITIVALGAFAFWSDTTEAQRSVFSKKDIETVKQKSLAYLNDRLANRGFAMANDDVKVTEVFIDDLNMGHTRVQQIVNNVPVWGGEAIVHLNKDGSLATITDDLVEASYVSTEPNFSREDSIKFATRSYKGSKFLTAEPVADLWIYPTDKGNFLVYRVQLRREDGSAETAMPVIFIDAQTGVKIDEYDNLQTATGSGASLYNGTVAIETYYNGSTYYLEGIGRKIGTFDSRNTTASTYRFSDSDNNWNTTTQRAAVDAHYGAAQTLDYYQNVHGRNGIDGSGGPGYFTSADGVTALISSKVHYSSNYNNAFWNGQFMTYGDGDGSTFTPLVTMDICGHEMTHGVTERTAGLIYQNESGALNESMSDVFGAMVERYENGGTVSSRTWQIGEDAYTPNTSGDALRDMSNTHSSGDPDHYSERYTGTADNGGVHTNSGISNYAFYLLSQGGTHHLSNVTVTGVGATAAEKIFYRALTTYMTSSTNFAAARTATLNAATDLYGASSSQYTRTATAWCAVGVGSCPASPTPTPGGGSNYVVNGGLEGSLSPWTITGNGSFYTANGSTPNGGSGYLYFGTASSVSGLGYQLISIPGNAPTANLTFALSVSTAETINRADDILEVRIYNSAGSFIGTLGTYDNRNNTGGSYIQSSSYNLSAYKGQSIYIAFSVSTDSGRNTTFRVDDVSVK